jgi:hypothetical protein
MELPELPGGIDIMKKLEGHWTGKYYGCYFYGVMSRPERLKTLIEPAEKNKIWPVHCMNYILGTENISD